MRSLVIIGWELRWIPLGHNPMRGVKYTAGATEQGQQAEFVREEDRPEFSLSESKISRLHTAAALMQPCGCMRSPGLIGAMFLVLSDTTVSRLLLRSTFDAEPTRMNATVGDSSRCERQPDFSVGP